MLRHVIIPISSCDGKFTFGAFWQVIIPHVMLHILLLLTNIGTKGYRTLETTAMAMSTYFDYQIITLNTLIDMVHEPYRDVNIMANYDATVK